MEEIFLTDDPIEKLRDIIVRSTLASLSCIAVGAIFYQIQVFDIHNPASAFMIWSIVGSLFFFSLRNLRHKDAFLTLMILFLIESVFLLQLLHSGKFLRATLGFVITPTTMYIFHWSFYSKRGLATWRDPIIVGGLHASVSLLSRIIYDILLPLPVYYVTIYYPLNISPDILRNFLVGFGLGIGIWLTDWDPVSRLLRLRSSPSDKLTDRRKEA